MVMVVFLCAMLFIIDRNIFMCSHGQVYKTVFLFTKPSIYEFSAIMNKMLNVK